MKLKPRDIDAFIRKPDPAAQAILLYGPDQGLVQERTRLLIKTVLDDVNDPFRLADLSEADLKSDPARLADEAAAISMMGGRRVVRVRGGGDTLSKTFKAFLDAPLGDALVVISAGELTPRSSLRKTFEDAKNAAAIPCYADDAGTLEAVIRAKLGEAGLKIGPEATAYLLAHLGGDRGVTLQELDKLVLYKGPGAEGAVTLDDVQACIGDTAAMSIDEVVDSALGGDLPALDRALIKAREADTHPVQLLNAVIRHTQQLHLLTGEAEAGAPRDGLTRMIRPPLHFKREAAVKRQINLWTRARLDRALQLLEEADRQCKTTGLPEWAVCAQALFRIGQGARAGRK